MTPESAVRTGSTWDHEAASYDASRQADAVYRSCIALTAEQIPFNTALCLDGGCGTGLSTLPLSARCETVIGVDSSLECLKILKGKGLPNVYCVQADLTALPFRPAAFDACACANTFQHLRPDEEQPQAIAELQRVVKAGGTLSISVHQFSRNKRMAGWIKEGIPGQPGIDYIFRFSPRELHALIPGSHVKGIGFYGLSKLPFLGSRLQNGVAYLLGRVAGVLGYGHMLLAVAKIRG